ncbi:hypothetical protein M0805_007461 [Coniferiporia weirii]|nr:hypothetical protein M0805_007461 [Coniferiporia weirii]
MEPPSLRELELETLLRERDSQVAELTDEVNQLRRYLPSQPAPSRSDPITLPPALLALLQPHINSQPPSGARGSTSSTMTAALVQRTRVLQEENDELYELLRLSETGKLKEEVHCLKRVVSRLEQALKDSHSTISSLSDELDKSYTAFLTYQRTNETNDTYRHDSRSPPHTSGRSAPADSSNTSTNGDLKPIPTAPRAHKKPRLSDTQLSPVRQSVPLPMSMSNSNATPLGTSGRSSRRDRSPRGGDGRKSPVKEARLEGDEDVKKGRQGSRDRSRDRQRERERDKGEGKERLRDRDRGRERRDRDRDADRHKEKDKDKERDRDRSRRNGTHGGRGSGGGGGGGGGSRKGARGNSNQDIGDRTLRERMGL